MIITENRLERIAWTLRNGDTALETAATIHSDLSRAFIRAECFSYDDLMACGNDIFVRILMASVYNFSGRDEEARIEAAQVLRINPKFSLEEYAKKIKYNNQDDKDRVIEAQRKAGLK